VYPRVQLQAGREKSLHFRHHWVFSRAIAHVPEKLENGSLVSVVDAQGNCLATAYYNRNSQIALRVLTFGDAVIDVDFFVAKFRELLAYRKRFIDSLAVDTNAFRLVFGESDGLPGLVVDVYGDFLVIQIHTLGMDKLKDLVVKALLEVLHPLGIIERSDLEVRKKERLRPLAAQVLFGTYPPSDFQISENGLKYVLDVKTGQKTGFFLDQRDNRMVLRKYVSGKKVLNLFSYSGGFSVSALKGKASQVTSVDISAPAMELAKRNFELNGFDPTNHNFIVKDVFDFLEDAAKKGDRYDVVVVDPPAFVKNRESLNHGTNAYIKLNHQAMKVLSDDGILVTSSCSSHVSPELFRTILFKAALQSHRELIILEQKIQPSDHPLNVNFPEGEYLKYVVCSARNIELLRNV